MTAWMEVADAVSIRMAKLLTPSACRGFERAGIHPAYVMGVATDL